VVVPTFQDRRENRKEKEIIMLQAKVLAWLEKTGFPLEMAAADAFRRASFEVRQSSIYADPETEKGREIDVLASDPDWIGAVEISFVVECKSSSKPWVVLTSDDALANYNRFHAFAAMTTSARDALIDKSPHLECMPYIERPSEGGYGFRQALLDGADPAYTAAMNVIKGCAGIARVSEKKAYKPLSIVFPVIVVDSPLFECRLQSDGQLALTEVDRSEFLFAAHIPEYVGCCIKVVTKRHLAEFANWARQLSVSLRSDLKSEEEKVLSSLK
jgi:hypothetical protein